MPDLLWYACVYESEGRIIYGRAPAGEPDKVLEDIKQSLHYHKLIGLRSKVFLRSSRFVADAVIGYCEKKSDRNPGDFVGYRVSKVDLRWDSGERVLTAVDVPPDAGEQRL